MSAIDDAGDGALVSCLMVTRLSHDRIDRALAAIAAFQAQTHARRELVVVIDQSADAAGRRALQTALHSAGPAPIRVVEIEGTPTLGALRNRALAAAEGEYVCQWDDDDIYHPERLSAQLAALRDGGHEALYLEDVLQFFPASRTLYWTNWRATEAGGHPGTLLMRRDAPVRYPESGPESRLGEDLALARVLRVRARLGRLAKSPHLFAYVSHGANSWDDGHHRMLAETLAISRGLLSRQEAMVREGVAGLDFGRGTLRVYGANGPAFEIPAPAPA
ncbi:MAG TPA: glycosyltransferase family A protein [Caulobacteraceae bacterium]